MSAPLHNGQAAQEPDSQALDWFVRRGRGLDAAEQADFQAWLAAHPAHGASLARWEDDWSELDALPAAGILALKRDLAAQQAEASGSDAAGPHAAGHRPGRLGRRHDTAKPRRRAFGGWLAGAALAAAALAAVGLGWLAWGQGQRPLYTHSYATARGEQRDVDLPDGSKLRLDTASRVEVAYFRGRRQVRLPEGQAFFEVAADAQRPFDVLAGPARVTVVGTRFSVRYTPGMPGGDGVRVAVEQGRVRVAPAGRWQMLAALFGAGGAVELSAGQQVAGNAAGEPGRISAVPAAGVAPWRDSRVSFDDTPLAQAIAEFERYGPTGLAVRDPATAALRLTGTFNPHRIDNFVRILPQVLPVRLSERGGVTEIAPRP